MAKVFDIDVLEGYRAKKTDIEMADPNAGFELAGKVFFGFGPGEILDEGGLDQEEDEEQDDKNGEQRL